jgi:co-chaperonin GroES (HSP10)
MKILPIRNNLVVRMLSEQELRGGGLIEIPNKHDQRTRVAEIVAVGDEVGMEWDRTEHRWFKVGQQYKSGEKVCITFAAGINTDLLTADTINGLSDTSEYRLITDQEIMARWGG